MNLLLSKKTILILSATGSFSALVLTLLNWQCLGWLITGAIAVNLVVAILGVINQLLSLEDERSTQPIDRG